MKIKFRGQSVDNLSVNGVVNATTTLTKWNKKIPVESVVFLEFTESTGFLNGCG